MKFTTWFVSVPLAAGLAACVQVPPPADPGQGVIAWHSGGAFHGSTGGRLYSNDILVSFRNEPFSGAKEKRHQMPDGSYDRALAWLRANPIPAKALAGSGECLDYGSDSVGWSGPGKAISYSANCPNERLLQLQSGLIALINPPAPPAVTKPREPRGSERDTGRQTVNPPEVEIIRPRGGLAF